MNREIKFRVWRELAKQMMPVLAFYWVPEPQNVAFLRPNQFGAEVYMPAPDIPVMQYTGLKDKNGLEIYEGDRIKVTDEHGNEDSGPVWYLPERASYCIVWHEGESSFSLADCKDQIDILGNIFEGDAEEVI